MRLTDVDLQVRLFLMVLLVVVVMVMLNLSLIFKRFDGDAQPQDTAAPHNPRAKY